MEVHKEPTVLYQLMLAPAKLKTGPFAKPPRETGADIHYAHSKLDYLLALPHADGSAVTLIVIDAKATDHVKLGARVQVAFYSLALKELLRHFVARRRRDASPPRPPLVMADFGGVWLYGEAAPATFGLADVERMLAERMLVKLPRILTKERAQIGYKTQRWHLGNHCFGCEYLKDCTKEASEEGRTGEGGLHGVQNVTLKQRLHLEASCGEPRRRRRGGRGGGDGAAPATLRSSARSRASMPASRRPIRASDAPLGRALLIQYDEAPGPRRAACP